MRRFKAESPAKAQSRKGKGAKQHRRKHKCAKPPSKQQRQTYSKCSSLRLCVFAPLREASSRLTHDSSSQDGVIYENHLLSDAVFASLPRARGGGRHYQRCC